MAENKVPIKQIKLTKENEILTIGSDYVETGSLPDGGYVGYHDVCQGEIDRQSVSNFYDILRCRGCGLRVYFPKIIKTVKDLKQYLDSVLKNVTDF